MFTQKITWTALPNGFSPNGLPLLSVFISPRLDTGGPDSTLVSFPDFDPWPANAIDWSVVFNGGNPIPVTVYSNVNDPAHPPARVDLWNAIFPTTTLVRGYKFVDLSGAPIRSYPIRELLDFLLDRYVSIASDPNSIGNFPGVAQLQGLYQDLSFFNDQEGKTRGAIVSALNNDVATNGYLTPPSGPDATAKTFVALEEFHQPRQPKPVDLVDTGAIDPVTGKPLQKFKLEKPELDFHQALTLCGDYTTLLRLLGLVVDLELPRSRPDGSPFPATGVIQALPIWTSALGGSSQDLTPKTRYVLDAGPGKFIAAPRVTDPLLVDGRLPFDDTDTYRVVTLDHDGGGLKSIHFANNLTRSQSPAHKTDDTPTTYSLPSLRSAGLAVAHQGTAAQNNQPAKPGWDGVLHKTLVRAKDLDTALLNQTAQLDAEDVTRGYRFDVFDSITNRWHSLTRRTGEFDFLRMPAGSQSVLVPFDEAFVTLATSSAADDSKPDLFIGQTLFRWHGWSLAVPRPGATIDPDSQVKDISNSSETDFQFESHFDVLPHSLPRLRFGTDYRIRARAVDLAGNSVPFGDDTSTDWAGLHATPVTTYGRWDPVQTPLILLRKDQTEGESIERLVVRSTFDQAWGLKANNSTTQRHVLPPKIAQLMAEEHGMFDVGGPVPLDPTTYPMIVARDAAPVPGATAGNPDGAGAPIDVDYLDVPYLPDVVSRGASFHNLPGTPDGSFYRVPFIDAGDTWPDYRSFRIVVEPEPTSPDINGLPVFVEDPPKFDVSSPNRVLTLHLSPGEVRTVRLSTALEAGDLRPGPGKHSPFALWQQIEALGLPSALADQLYQAALRGEHWMLTPWHDITLVHAVRQPLLTPEFRTFDDSKSAFGQTFAVLRGEMQFSRRTTGRLDMFGSWPEPSDGGPGTPDPLGPGAPLPAPTAGALAFTADLSKMPEGKNDAESRLPILERHEFGDTKHRNVTYSAVATTKFPEYFTERTEITVTVYGDPGKVNLDPNGVVHGSVVVRLVDPGQPDDKQLFDENVAYAVDEDSGNIRFLGPDPSNPDLIVFGSTVEVAYLAQPATQETRAPKLLNIPSSARPAAPKVAYVVPAFKWTTGAPSTTTFASTRHGAVRVYLERPWFTSGIDELLGVTLWPGAEASPQIPLPQPEPAGKNPMKPYVTQWGLDPIYGGINPPTLLPKLSSFPSAVATGGPFYLDELPFQAGQPDLRVNVAGHAVTFDPDRDMWYADIEVNFAGNIFGAPYMPFLRMAMARYQPSSIAVGNNDVHLSRVVLADFIQLTPDRSASIVYDPKSLKASITLTGQSYAANETGAGPGIAKATLERKDPGVAGDLGWNVERTATLTVNKPFLGQPYWTGILQLKDQPVPGRYRIVLEQYEVFKTDAVPPGFVGPPKPGSIPQPDPDNRLVYSDIIPLTNQLPQ